MAKDDFDLDFDFKNEYGLDPDMFLNGEESAEDTGRKERSSEPSQRNANADFGAEEEEDFDLDADLDDFLNMGARRTQEQYTRQESAPDQVAEDLDAQLPEEDIDPQEADYSDDNTPDGDNSDTTTQEKSSQRTRRRKEPKERDPAKPAAPNVFTKFYDLYFAPVLNKELVEEPQDPVNPRRRRKKSKMQIFKEVYLPPIIACTCLILVMAFLVGTLSNFIAQRELARLDEESRKNTTQDAEAIAAAERQAIMDEAELLAMGYDYEAAIAKLDSYGDLSAYTDMAAKRAEYANTQSQLVEYQDPTLIPNFSFHPLIVDPARAFGDVENGGNYNRNFVLLTEFTKILTTLYNNGYVLVDFDSFTTYRDGNIYPTSIYLPYGKKPMMLTETLLNYFQYMVDPDKDGIPDANGAGFANKLVVDSNGDIKAEYVDSSGNTLVGDYDLVPVLESFIKEHPDFVYQGARAILAVTGHEGIFGYRINTSYISSVSQTFYDEQIAGVKTIVQALKDKGYTLACHTYENVDYAKKNANQITEDLQKWTSLITPIWGEVDTFVFARASNIADYSGASFQVLYSAGFRYFVSNADTPTTQVNTTYVRQNRIMVTGNALAWKADKLKDYFDCNTIIELATRGGNVPN